MFKEYVTQPGDTFSSISRALTGSERNATLIKQSNPHAQTPLKAGTTLFVKTGGSAKKTFKPFGLDVKIDGSSVPVYNNFTLSMAIDSFSRAEFILPNEPEFRTLIPPAQPTSIDIGYNGSAVFSGYVDTPKPQETDKEKSILIQASSWPTLLMNTAPITSFPWGIVDMDLEVIAGQLIAPFGIEWFFYSDFGPKFSKLEFKQSDKVLDFLSGLCKERGLVIRDDQFGSVVFDNGTIAGEPILVINGETRPDADVGPAVIDTSKYYSSVTCVLKSKNKRKRKRITVENPHYRGIVKPHEFEIKNSDEGEIETAVNTVAARMFAGLFQLPITIPGWTDRNGEVIRPGASVSVRSPKDYIDDFYELLISEVTLNGTGDTKTATLTCVLPGVYSGNMPESLPWT